MRQALIYKDHEDDGWIAEIPSLPGCVSQGDTKADALRNVKDAMNEWISAAQAEGRAIPADEGGIEICEIAEK